MGRVVHFEIHVDNPERAGAFYKAVFGWDIKRWGEHEYWLVMTEVKNGENDKSQGEGIDSVILKRQSVSPDDGAPVNGYVNTIEIPSLD